MNLTPPSGLNQMNHPTSDMVGKDLGSTGNPHLVQVQNKHAFPPYGFPPNYTPPNKNFNNSTPILTKSQQPQFDHAHVSQPMGGTHEKLLMHFFQESLTGQLSPGILTWNLPKSILGRT